MISISDSGMPWWQVLELRRWLGNVALFFSGASEKAVLGSGDGWVGMFIADVSRRFFLQCCPFRKNRGAGMVYDSLIVFVIYLLVVE
jgi:hypothetical protein